MATAPSTDLPGYRAGVAVTKSDATVLPRTAALYVGVAGDVTVQFVAGTSVLLKALPVGIHRISVIRIMSTGTAATDMVALY